MRANEILSDEEQRAAYDHLLDLARLEQESASKPPIAAAIHKLASSAMALAGVSCLTIGGYLLFIHISAASVAPPNEVEVSRGSSEIAAVTSAEPRDTNGQNASPAKYESASVAGEANAPSAVTSPDCHIIFNRLQRIDRAFADIAQVSRIKTASRTGPAPTIDKRQRVEPRAKRVSPQRTAEQDPSREEGFPFVGVR